MVGQNQLKDMSGLRFGSLIVIERNGYYRNTTHAAWLVRCDCGKEWTVDGSSLRQGLIVSCGCKKGGKITHGMSAKSIYKVWQSMKARCSNPNNAVYYRYGGRGIRVCERWADFEMFLLDMGVPPVGMTMDRINNDGNYEKSNCRWATRKTQANNTRRNVFIETPLGSLSMDKIAEIAGVTYNMIQKRLESGLKGADLLLPKYTRFARSTTC